MSHLTLVGSLRSSRFLSFTRRRSNNWAKKWASAWGEQEIREKWVSHHFPSLQFFAHPRCLPTCSIFAWNRKGNGCYADYWLVAGWIWPWLKGPRRHWPRVKCSKGDYIGIRIVSSLFLFALSLTREPSYRRLSGWGTLTVVVVSKRYIL